MGLAKRHPWKQALKPMPKNVWTEYTRRKKALETRALTPSEYEAEIRKIAKELGI